MYAQRDDEGLGIALPAIGGAISLVSSIFGGGPNKKDPGRIAGNTKALNQVLAGDPNGPFYGTDGSLADAQGPLHFLQVHSVMNDADGGWATQVASTDAMNKLNQAKQFLAARGQPATAASSSYGLPPVSGGPVIAGLSTGPLLLAGAAALGIVMLTRRGRR